jgi:phosphohistidine swiveling domain-containing protein
MFVPRKDISATDDRIGSKTKNLKRLAELGLNVPEFIAIDTHTVTQISSSKGKLDQICESIRVNFLQERYAIRSSAMIEDTEQSSMAGRFHTEIDVTPKNLEAAIMNVIDQANEVLKNNSNGFSLIVQKYIKAEFSGVCFTRNPNGSREMMVEYHKGVGEELVSGQVNPVQEAFYHSQKFRSKIFDADIFARIETEFGFAQDIEWCSQNGELYLLQTRPITTITKQQYKEIVFLEEQLKAQKEKDYFFQKTQLSEISPRPTPFTTSLIQKLFEPSGPIQTTYQQHRIDYQPQKCIKIIGNELFVDREAELKTLMPALSILNRDYTIKCKTIRGAWRTLKNMIFTALISEHDNCTNLLFNKLTDDSNANNLDDGITQFINDYQLIFETNLLAAKYVKKAQILLRKENIHFGEVLTADSLFLNQSEQAQFAAKQIEKNIIGNTLELSDTTEFITSLARQKASDGVATWWKTLPQWKQSLYASPIAKAIRLQKSIELARMLMLKNLSEIRNQLLQQSPFAKQQLAVFHTIDEIKSGTFSESMCQQRKADYEKGNTYTLPNTICARHVQQPKENLGISTGTAEGFLASEHEVKKTNEPIILYTKNLSPSLVTHFGKIKGIITEHGGLLSHLAILAREQKIPVVVIGNSQHCKVGDFVRIDGSSGEISEVDYSAR